jgi:hypothetical protein
MRLAHNKKIYMTSTGPNGRLGNQIIRNLAVSLLAEKHNLKVDYYNKDLINKLGIELFSGSNLYNIEQEDGNYFSIYTIDEINYNLSHTTNYFFQTKEISNILYNYLHKDNIKLNIINNNPFKKQYNNNNDLHIHIRLTDVKRWNPELCII